MSTPNAQAGAISFAHLAGITTPIRAKAEAPSDDKDEKKDAKKAEGDDDGDEQMESDAPDDEGDEDEKKDAKAEGDEPEEEDEKKDAKKAKSAFSRGFAAANARVASVLGSKSFARNPALGAHLLVNSTMSASAILGVLRDAPAAASSNDAARSARNPNLGAAAPAVAPSTDARWGAAFKRAGIG